MNRHSADLNDYNEECNEIWVNKHKDKMILICKKYLRFLNKSESWSGVFSFYDVSLLLNYWIYDELTKIYVDENTNEIDIGFGVLQGKWGKFNSRRRNKLYYENCRPEPTKVNHKDWQKRKELYDYCINYNYLYNMANFSNNKCEYYKRIQDKKSLYEYFEEECSTRKNNCPDFCKQCESYNPKLMLPDLECQAEMQKDPAEALEQSSDNPAHKLRPEFGEGASELQRPTASAQDTQLTSQSSDIGTKVTNSVLGAGPVMLTATMLYRYTPLGPWIRRFGGGGTNSMNAMDALSSYTQETGNMLSDDSANYISYQPI
ncbi:hypothetical protein PVBG_06025 [Plasmodium vivax Brazil I]|uniref:VIR protein n=1 Tax=Plasmodium vivax (strain Brazil I) TaxID=1033975 RepID=A0A0J9SJM7_PLAV1|nr:hypothetical protein PVBG_06025 [Plasmodium vivax Brazil I]